MPATVSGEVTARLVLGVKEGAIGEEALVEMNHSGILVYDHVLDDLFQGQAPSMIVNSSLDQEMRDRGFSLIEYHVNINISGMDRVNQAVGGLSYSIQRSDFNLLGSALVRGNMVTLYVKNLGDPRGGLGIRPTITGISSSPQWLIPLTLVTALCVVTPISGALIVKHVGR
jgi:hypothetical protein